MTNASKIIALAHHGGGNDRRLHLGRQPAHAEVHALTARATSAARVLLALRVLSLR
ncbi:MAG: hypothetical protein ABSE63_09535 [Thermoguttaceae bacterium]